MHENEISQHLDVDDKPVPNFLKWQPWSHHDDAILTRLYRYDVIEELAELLGRTVKSVYHRAFHLNLERAINKTGNSYHVRVIRVIDDMVMYERLIPAGRSSVKNKNNQVKKWHQMFEDKFITGEWEMSIINGFEQYE